MGQLCIAQPYFQLYTLQTFNCFLIPETTDRKTTPLIVVVSVSDAIVGIQVAIPSIVCIVLSSTPPVTVVANVVEITIVVTVATRKGCKSNHSICCISIFSQYNLL